MSKNVEALEQFHWTPQPAAEKLVHDIVDRLIARSPEATKLRDRMRDETGTRLIDWLDSIHLPLQESWTPRLEKVGFEKDPADDRVFIHGGGVFPRIVLADQPNTTLFIKVESVADFAQANGRQSSEIQGPPLSQLRLLRLTPELCAVERHGFRGFSRPEFKPADAIAMASHLESFLTRRRDFDNDLAGFALASELVDAAIARLGIDLTCDLFFHAERDFWQRRNRAAQFQKSRQDKLGLGWANHDHHTYRSSRKHFSRMISIFEKLGFVCRERFYAGADSGWGAQVLEQPTAGVIIFADVDLSPDELFNDFAHEPLPERKQLGTVGLWCALHGEAFLQAGMHHLECQFDFDSLKKQLEESAGIRVMKPFTNFPYLRQAFTEGERWPVAEQRLSAVLAAGQLTPEQAEQIRSQGAIGSHLENLERNEGFKGFNQKGVSEIIAKTDPRRHLAAT
jgi:hypothetical protein